MHLLYCLQQNKSFMGLNNFGRLFMPKNKIFYTHLFEEVADTVEEMGKTLLKSCKLNLTLIIRAPIIKLLEDLEHRNDETTHKIFTELGSVILLLPLIERIFTI